MDMFNDLTYLSTFKNFSKSKFVKVLKRTLLNPDSYEFKINFNYISDDLILGEKEFELDIRSGFTIKKSVDKWLFQVEHIEDGLLRPNLTVSVLEKRIKKIFHSYKRNKNLLHRLQEDLLGFCTGESHRYRRSAQSYRVGEIYYYYLSNVNLSDMLLYSTLANDFNSIIRSSDHWHNYFEPNIHIGFGSPEIFFINSKNEFFGLIDEYESIPDAISIEFVDGSFVVKATNKRLFSVVKNMNPMVSTVEQHFEPKNKNVAESINEFEYLLNNKKTKEYELQRFFENNPLFLLGLDYDEFCSQVTLCDKDGKLLKPDFFIKPVQSDLWDILEIKLPKFNLIAGKKNRERLSWEIRQGISQLREYSEYFNNISNRDRLYREMGIDCFDPKLNLVIGNKKNVNEQLWNKIIEFERPLVKIIGFDELLENVKKIYNIYNYN